MRVSAGVFHLLFFLLLSATASAADLKIKVVDPQGVAVAGAQVSLFGTGTGTSLSLSFTKIAMTSAEGIATFAGLPSSSYEVQVQVLAAGFAPYKQIDAGRPKEMLTIRVEVAVATETVVVSATRTLVSADESGASISTLENGELEAMQPVAESDAMRFVPGAVVSAAGQRGGLASLFVRGGDSVYNKFIIDGVPVTEPGGIFDSGTVPLAGADRMEFLRGAQSTLYGTDAMTSVVQVFSRTGSTEKPELRFGADGGNFGTAHGFAELSGARGIWDYSFFADQFNTRGLGVNNDYSNSLQGGNAGVRLSDAGSLRVRVRHSNNRSGIPENGISTARRCWPRTLMRMRGRTILLRVPS